MHNDYLKKAIELNQGREAYATAIIVRRKIPSSGKPGDRAIITNEGSIHGWIGGGCTRGIVLKEALLSIQEARPRLVTISPDSTAEASTHQKIYKMTCQSGGEVEIYIEPVLPKPHIVIFGVSHIAMALANISKTMNYQVSCIGHSLDKTIYPTADVLIESKEYTPESLQENSYIVVCTQGEGDAEALHQALQSSCEYLAFVASRKKANAIFKELRGRGITFDQLKTIKTPAGIDINAKLPEEVAVSILAEIVADIRSETEASDAAGLTINNDDFYMNPVCQIPIQKSTAKHVIIHKEEKVYFCCDGCKVKFEADPAAYITV